ncbi:MerR family transcriptional regulator [Alkalibacillus sp. S2W]|uniref:MerR family transcriptional regulator n=1 Tax=Alkalibacillus sp. S2W TaxID=3386553 RepID=UPI00398D46F9
MLTIKEASERVCIPTSTIRYYDEEQLLPFVERDENGYRRFNENDLFWLEMISCMRETGMPIKTLRHVAHLYMQGPSTVEERKNIFEDHQTNLIQQKEQIDDALEKIHKKMEVLDS